MSRRRGLRWTGLALLVGLVLAWAMRAFIGDIYAVHSASMEPTLHGGEPGERVLVRYGGLEHLERFDLVVFQRPGQAAPIVKRVLGLPGESLELVDGDLTIGGRLLPPEVRRPPWVLLFDSTRQGLADWFQFKAAPAGPWSPPEEPWRLSALELSSGDNAGMAFFYREATSGFLPPEGDPVTQPFEANDLQLELDCRVLETARQGELRLRLLEKGDFFQARFVFGAEGPISVVLEREPGEEGAPCSEMARAELPRERFPIGRESTPRRLSFSNRDDQLVVGLNGQELLSTTYAGNRAYPGLTPPNRQSLGPRIAFGGSGLSAEFSAIRLSRDPQWLSAPAFGPHASTRLTLGPDEFFVAGDNSYDSTDSRYFGPIPRRALLGRPIAICWPPSHWRWLK